VHVPVAGTVALAGLAACGGCADLAAPGAAGYLDRRWWSECGLSAGKRGGCGAAGGAPIRQRPLVPASRAGAGRTAARGLDLQAFLLRAGRRTGAAGAVVGQGGADGRATGPAVP